MLKHMLLKILKMILYFFVIFAKPVYADNFDSSIDTSDNQYYQTIALGVNDYPNISNIEYKKEDFLAEKTESILNSDIGAFTDFDFTRRIPMVADHVDAPPGTQVDIVYLYKNLTGHEVNISKVSLVLSRNNMEKGNLMEVLDIPEYFERDLAYKYSNLNLVKSGIHKEYEGVGLVDNEIIGTYFLESFKVRNPLNIDNVSISKNESGGVDFEIYVQNNSKEYLNNIKFKYDSYEEVFNISSQQEYVVRFSISDVPSELEKFSIYNPNTKQVCAVYGSPFYTYTQTDAIPVFAYRGANIVPGAAVQPERESFCIKRIPYTMISEPMVLNQKKDTNTVNLTDINEESEGGNVLGTSDTVLPKTGKHSIALGGLLVVDGLLWYSVYILRRNYEGKNTNSRVRTKSKQNAQ
jgi:hypothetical protein